MPLLAVLVLWTEALVTIPPSEWRAVPVEVSRNRSLVECTVAVHQPGSRIQAIFIDRQDAERFQRGRSVHPLAASAYLRQGRLRIPVPEAGDYVLILDNRLEGRTSVDVEVKVDISSLEGVTAKTLPPARRRLVVALSILFFGAVVFYSASQFLKHTRS